MSSMSLSTLTGMRPYTVSPALIYARSAFPASPLYYPLPMEACTFTKALRCKLEKCFNWFASLNPDSPRNRLIMATKNYAQAYARRFNAAQQSLVPPQDMLAQPQRNIDIRFKALRQIRKAFPLFSTQLAEDLVYFGSRV